MLRGTTLDELMEAVTRAERQAQERRAGQIEPSLRESWPQVYPMQAAEPSLVEVA